VRAHDLRRHGDSAVSAPFVRSTGLTGLRRIAIEVGAWTEVPPLLVDVPRNSRTTPDGRAAGTGARSVERRRTPLSAMAGPAAASYLARVPGEVGSKRAGRPALGSFPRSNAHRVQRLLIVL